MPSVSEVLTYLIDKEGQKAVADAIGVDISTVSRIRSGDIGMRLQHIDTLISRTEYCLVPKKHHENMKNAIITIADLLKEG